MREVGREEGEGGRDGGGQERGKGRREGEGRGGEWRGVAGNGGEGRGGSEGPERSSGSLPPMYSMIMYSRSVKFSGITSPIGPPTLCNITSSNVER